MKIISICAVIAAIVTINPLQPADVILFGANLSPNRQLIVENYGDIIKNNGQGYILIRNIGNGADFTTVRIPLSEPSPAIFMIWSDDSHLNIEQDKDGYLPSGPGKVGGLTISYSRYTRDKSAREGTTSSVDIRPDRASAQFIREIHSGGIDCILSANLRDGTLYDSVGFRIDASINKCKGRICGGISSHFSVGAPVHVEDNRPLTSATISDIASYNELPTGVGHHEVKGSFLGDSAEQLSHSLSDPWMSIRYTFNFGRASTVFRLPASSMSSDIQKFNACISGVDFNWLKHQTK